MAANLPRMSVRRPPFRALASIAMLALLAFAVAAAPALSFAAEAHEAIEHAGDHRGGDASGHDHADAPQPGDGGEVMHLVMHLATCCGHACAVLPMALPLPAHALSAPPDARVHAFPPDNAGDDPLRPPIAA